MVGGVHDRRFGRKLIRKGQIMPHSRRSFLAEILGTTSAVAVGLANRGVSAAGPLRVALLTPGLTNDGSFNQVALEAVVRLKRDGLIRYEVREKMRDPAASEPIIRQYAARRYDLIIGHGIELSEPVLNVAKDFASVHFAASGGPDLAGKLLVNVDGWTYDFAQLGYLSGWVAGKLIGISKVGMVGGPQLPFILASHKGFKAGLAATNAKAQVVETFTGSFDDVQRAVEATRGLIGQGAQVVWTSGDGIGNGVAAAANQAGIYTLGVTGSAGGLAKKVNIASVELDMYPTFRTYVDSVKAGTFGKRFFVSGLANKGLVLSKVNRVGKVVPPDLEKEVNLLVTDLGSGKKTLPDFYAK
jgi:basic membrane lipoprotein Med (substrate-binding protein (PBP1-ABC) superfamily)